MPARLDRGPAVRTPSVALSWLVQEIASLFVSGLVAIIVYAICASLLAMAYFCGAGHWPLMEWNPAIVLIVDVTFLGVLDRAHRKMRALTRPSPLPPPVEITSGRSTTLYDRELDS
jgi:hypothetical protein